MTDVPAGYEEAVCRMGQGEATCSFLTVGPGGNSMYGCAKGSELERTIKQRRAAGSMRAQGDNCSGPPAFEPTGDS